MGFERPTVLKKARSQSLDLGATRRAQSLTWGQLMVPAVSRLMRCMGPRKREACGEWDGMTKRIHLRPRITCNHMHVLTHTPLLFPLDAAPFWIDCPDTPHAAPAISPRFLGSQGRVPIELLFLLKIKSDSRPDPGDRPGFPLGGVRPTPFYPFPYLHCNVSLSLSIFFCRSRPRSRPCPSCIVHLPACSHMTC